MKKIMMLGGNAFQLSATKRAKELGYYVISVDYLPDNPAHKFADEYHNVSTTDKDAVLALAKELKIDGILSFASDVSAPTAAYVAEALGLPTNPYEAVMILTHKDLFRDFMTKNNLQSAHAKAFKSLDDGRDFFNSLDLPLIIKPVDSSGSKGVVKVTERTQYEAAYKEAESYSLSKHVIIEDYIQKYGYEIDGDGFVKDGKIIFFGVMDQHNDLDMAPYVPIGLSRPSIQDPDVQKKAQDLIQKIYDLLGVKFGAFNFEYITDKNGEVYLLEIGPRNGGNFIPDTIKYSTGIDMITASIKACVGDNYDDCFVQTSNKIATSFVVHSLEDGRYKGLDISDEVKDFIVENRMFVEPGDKVKKFHNGGDTIGIMCLEFDTVEHMNHCMDNMNDYIKVLVE